MSRMLSASDAVKHRKRLTELFSYCKLESTGEMPDTAFCESKIDDLIAYLADEKAFLFAEPDEGDIEGFLWACRIIRDGEERFHTLYFAVGENAQGKGLGSKLILNAEKKAEELGIAVCELNVHSHNEKAKIFYIRRGYTPKTAVSEERVTLSKCISTSRNVDMDIYFDENYGKLYAKAEKGEAVVREYKCAAGTVRHQFIIRKIDLPTDGVYYDAVTPYGYGGPIITSLNDGYTAAELASMYEADFAEYAKEHNVVSEFVRFHPICKNALDFKEVYSAECIRHTLITDLTAEDPVAEQFSKSCRKNIRRAINSGVSYRVTKSPENVDAFREVYYSTMDRNRAGDYYYFGDEYFADCLKYYRDNIVCAEAIYEGKTIAAGIYFVCKDVIHVHLSGTLSEYLHLSPAYVLRYAIAVWGKENGYKLIHHGGGRTNSPEDSLYLFKKQFAVKNELEFYVGKKVWNDGAYRKLCDIAGVDGKG
ncbi:MAG: peptidoglycan bridge formation glycyltransferase FemA/FemB family protein, partial [Clostridia bacterium]|nr:peptidoglycan bridge formation glycyltransferase FemA/FemB family protein [Clostridia bacterium]